MIVESIMAIVVTAIVENLVCQNIRARQRKENHPALLTEIPAELQQTNGVRTAATIPSDDRRHLLAWCQDKDMKERHQDEQGQQGDANVQR